MDPEGRPSALSSDTPPSTSRGRLSAPRAVFLPLAFSLSFPWRADRVSRFCPVSTPGMMKPHRVCFAGRGFESADHLDVKGTLAGSSACDRAGQRSTQCRLVGTCWRSVLHARRVCARPLRRCPPSYDYGKSFEHAERRSTPSSAEESSRVRRRELVPSSPSWRLRHSSSASRPTSFRFAVHGQAPDRMSHAVRYQDAARMLHLADLARLAAEACPIAAAGSAPDRPTCAPRPGASMATPCGCWDVYARRRRRSALATQRSGTARDPLLRASLCTQSVSLRLAQRRFDEAIDLDEEAGQIFAEIGDDHSFASTLVQKAIACLYAGEAEESIRILNGPSPRSTPNGTPICCSPPASTWCARYIELGRSGAGALDLFRDPDLYRRSTDPLFRLRLAWQEGLLLRDLGHLPASKKSCCEARQGFVDRGLFCTRWRSPLSTWQPSTSSSGPSPSSSRPWRRRCRSSRRLGVDREPLGSLLQLQQLSQQNRQALALVQVLNSRTRAAPDPRRPCRSSRCHGFKRKLHFGVSRAKPLAS